MFGVDLPSSILEQGIEKSLHRALNIYLHNWRKASNSVLQILFFGMLRTSATGAPLRSVR